jgi:plastocyanin
MRFLLTAPLLALSLTLAPAASAAAAAPSRAAPAAKQSAKTVRIENFTFSPPTLQVKAGSTVTWTNADDIPHNVVAKNGAFRSKVLDTGDSFSFTFKTAGEFVYFCGLHPHMVGKIIVTR